MLRGALGLDSLASAYEIVGVAEETWYKDVRWNYSHPMSFVPLAQRAAGTKLIEKKFHDVCRAIVVETSWPMDDMETLARKTLTGINPNLSKVKFQTFVVLQESTLRKRSRGFLYLNLYLKICRTL
jgi:macrolide transport system ATP-binding/permease protein